MEYIDKYSDVIVTSLIVLAGLFILLFAWRQFSKRVRGRKGQRLGISEYRELDQLRRLVLVRRDNVEHLLLIGGPSDVVVETNIGATGSIASIPAPEAGEERAAPVVRPAPRAPVFSDRRPPSLRGADPALAPAPRLRDPQEP